MWATSHLAKFTIIKILCPKQVQFSQATSAFALDLIMGRMSVHANNY